MEKSRNYAKGSKRNHFAEQPVTEQHSVTGTHYDNAFRTLISDCTELIIPLVNMAFNENYTGKEEIRFFPNEHFIAQGEGDNKKRITDTCFIIKGASCKKYHWECESRPDSSILVKMFEYDSQIALDTGEIIDNTLVIEFPHAAVLFLRCSEDTPDKMTIRIKVPEDEAVYDIPVLKARSYRIDEIFDKNLLFLIPFYIFSHEGNFPMYNDNEDARKKLRAEYEDIRNRLERLYEDRAISGFTKRTIIEMSEHVLEQIAQKYKQVQKEVKSIMRGPVIQTEARNILDQGIEIGYNRGMENMLIMLAKDGTISVTDAVSRCRLSPEEFERRMKDAYADDTL